MEVNIQVVLAVPEVQAAVEQVLLVMVLQEQMVSAEAAAVQKEMVLVAAVTAGME